MSFSIQTNVSSIIAQENLRVNNEFQGRTIGRLTSGYRINASGDDAAGLAIANKFRSDITELVQGVRNANDGISVLQIVDGGLNNISKVLDRLKTLATQSASDTFTGDRTILNNEYKALLSEIDRQAANIGLTQNGANNKLIGVYIGGGNTQSNSQVQIDLSGQASQVDASALGLSTTGISGGGTTLTGNTVRLDNPAVAFLTNDGGTATQAFTFQLYDNGSTSVTVNVTGDADGITGQQVVDQLNAALSSYGINASLAGSGPDAGELQFGGAVPFSVSVAAATNTAASTEAVTASSTAVNEANNRIGIAAGDFVAVTAGTESVTFANANGNVSINFDTTTGASVAAAIQEINAQACRSASSRCGTPPARASRFRASRSSPSSRPRQRAPATFSPPAWAPRPSPRLRPAPPARPTPSWRWNRSIRRSISLAWSKARLVRARTGCSRPSIWRSRRSPASRPPNPASAMRISPPRQPT